MTVKSAIYLAGTLAALLLFSVPASARPVWVVCFTAPDGPNPGSGETILGEPFETTSEYASGADGTSFKIAQEFQNYTGKGYATCFVWENIQQARSHYERNIIRTGYPNLRQRMVSWRTGPVPTTVGRPTVEPVAPGQVYMFCRLHQYNTPNRQTPAYYSTIFPVTDYRAPNEGIISANMSASFEKHVEFTYSTSFVSGARLCGTGNTIQEAETRKNADQQQLLRSGYGSTTRIIETAWSPN